jgi:hypothetical protein
MTVPTDFRRSSAIPEILVLHRAHLESSDVQEIHGVRVTRPLRTIVDLLRSGNVDRSQLKGELTPQEYDLCKIGRSHLGNPGVVVGSEPHFLLQDLNLALHFRQLVV